MEHQTTPILTQASKEAVSNAVMSYHTASSKHQGLADLTLLLYLMDDLDLVETKRQKLQRQKGSFIFRI